MRTASDRDQANYFEIEQLLFGLFVLLHQNSKSLHGNIPVTFAPLLNSKRMHLVILMNDVM
jgi:hypothetical protein